VLPPYPAVPQAMPVMPYNVAPEKVRSLRPKCQLGCTPNSLGGQPAATAEKGTSVGCAAPVLCTVKLVNRCVPALAACVPACLCFVKPHTPSCLHPLCLRAGVPGL
jgi:hypothetical protein